MKDQHWTDRIVQFHPFPSHINSPEWDDLFDSLPDHYWDRPARIRRWLEPVIASSDGVITVGALPLWMPAWWAMRTVCRLAAEARVGGYTTFHVERTVLLATPEA